MEINNQAACVISQFCSADVHYTNCPKQKSKRGFADLSPEARAEMAKRGGKAAHAKGTGHEWTSEQAREAGRKGGLASSRKKNGT